MSVLRIVDSITELGAHDKGCIAVSGSHGGLSSARYALAACTVAHHSACIGEAKSTLASGVVSAANAAASALGVQVGWTCQQAVDFLLNSQEST